MMQKELGWYLFSVLRKKYKSKRRLKKNPPKWSADAEALEANFFVLGPPGDDVLIRVELLIDPAASNLRTWGERLEADCFFRARDVLECPRPVRLGTLELIPKIDFF